MFEPLKWLPPLLARVVMGVVFVISGWHKLHGLARFADVLTRFHVPAPAFFSPLVAYCEFIGGILLLAGLFTRFAVLPLTAIMIVALATAKAAQITSVTALFGASELGYVLLFAYLFVFGAGALSFDALFYRAYRRRRPRPVEREHWGPPPAPPEPTFG